MIFCIILEMPGLRQDKFDMDSDEQKYFENHQLMDYIHSRHHDAC